MTADTHGPILIKRYAGSRLYDTKAACYVTLQDIAEMLEGRQDVAVVEAGSGRDITQAVLAEIGARRR